MCILITAVLLLSSNTLGIPMVNNGSRFGQNFIIKGFDSDDIPQVCADSNCLKCPESIRKCTACDDGFKLVGDECEICTSVHCIKCSKSIDICEKCEDGLLAFSDGRCRKCEDPGCASCPSSPNICSECTEGFRKAGGGCESCLGGCRKCDEDIKKCTACAGGYKTLNTKTGNRCRECKIIGCEVCSDITKCDKCFEWFGECRNNFNPDDDDLPPTGDQGCESFGCLSECSDNTDCTTCDATFYLESGECKDCTDIHIACNLCVSPKECIRCLDGFGLIKKGPVTECEACKTEDCKRCDFNTDKCTECNYGHRLAAGKCKPCASGCNSCSAKSNCIDCKPGYQQITKTKKIKCRQCTKLHCGSCAKKRNQCDACKRGFGFEKKQCKRCSDEFCASCPQNPDKCVECKPDFFGQCDASPCANKYCKKCSQNPNKCTDCFGGFYLSGDTCKKCRVAVPDCAECSLQGKCTKCDPTFSLVNGSCKRG